MTALTRKLQKEGQAFGPSPFLPHEFWLEEYLRGQLYGACVVQKNLSGLPEECVIDRLEVNVGGCVGSGIDVVDRARSVLGMVKTL